MYSSIDYFKPFNNLKSQNIWVNYMANLPYIFMPCIIIYNSTNRFIHKGRIELLCIYASNLEAV